MSNFNGFYHDEKMSERVFIWIKELESENERLNTVVQVLSKNNLALQDQLVELELHNVEHHCGIADVKKQTTKLQHALDVSRKALEETIYDSERLQHGQYARDAVESALFKIEELLK